MAEEVEVKVAVFAFDLLYLNGEPLMSLPLRKRRQLLMDSFDDTQPRFHFAQHRDIESVEEIQVFLEEAMAAGCEGLMVKTLDVEASYEPSKRSRHWLKIKKDYLQGMGLVALLHYFMSPCCLSRHWRLCRPRPHWGLSRKGQTNRLLRGLPPCLLRSR